MLADKPVIQGYQYAKDIYGQLGVDIDAALKCVDRIPISMHCWQGDNFHGLDGKGNLSGGIAVTGNYPGCPRNVQELRDDIEEAFRLIPGTTRLNLHASYAQLGGSQVDRDQYTIEHFAQWVEFALKNGVGLDFNPTFFAHPKMDGNFTLASGDESVRKFWVEHGKRCREIGESMGKRLQQVCVVNYWMPDGFKDTPADTRSYRERMAMSLDEIFEAPLDHRYVDEAIESKLFGLGLESYTVASHEFSLGYAISRQKTYCLDCGHFHPTEDMGDKVSALMLYVPKLLLHTSRGVRWDSDHVVTFEDGLKRLMREVIAGSYLDRIYIAQDYFDGSINRIACWAIAMRNTRKALLQALLEPRNELLEAERAGNYSKRLLCQETYRTLPLGAVWDYYCALHNRPTSQNLLPQIQAYEKAVLSQR